MTTPRAIARQRFQLLAVLMTLIGIAVTLALILRRTEGALIYTLDDPYIHLALAENILRGHFGINLNEFASPSSSILYPLLLTGLLATGAGTLAPLILNVIGAAGSAVLLAGIAFDSVAVKSTTVTPLRGLILLALLTAINVFGLPFTGMEHSLHVWVSLAIVAGLAKVNSGRLPTWGFVAALVAAPLLRFEGFALSGAAIIALFWLRQPRPALIAAALIAGFTGAYAATMYRLGLPLLPSSVMVKSGVSAAAADNNFGAMISAVRENVGKLWGYDQARILIAGAVLLALSLLQSGQRYRPLIAAVLAANLAHLAVGRYDWFSRYEVYAIAITLATVLIAYRDALQRSALGPGFVLAASLATGAFYDLDLMRVPAASENTFTQQYQMHRFATEFMPASIAAADIGWVSYRNDNYVLDLWGLGSETVRKAKETGISADWIDDLTRRNGIVYGMLYEEPFGGQLPAHWCKIAKLTTPRVMSAYESVNFYVIDPGAEPQLRAALAAFEQTLPQVDRLEVYPCPAR